jgi:hypothetical protein
VARVFGTDCYTDALRAVRTECRNLDHDGKTHLRTAICTSSASGHTCRDLCVLTDLLVSLECLQDRSRAISIMSDSRA